MLPNATGAVIDLTPKSLAEALDALVNATLESDREVAALLVTAREGLRALAWNRYVAYHTARSRARVLRRRHQGLCPAQWRKPA